MCSALRFTTSNCSGSSLNISADICSFQHHPVLIKHHQQTLLRLLGAPEHQEHWEHWDSIGPSRNDQQCPFLVRSSQESRDLSGASPPFQEVLDLPDCI